MGTIQLEFVGPTEMFKKKKAKLDLGISEESSTTMEQAEEWNGEGGKKKSTDTSRAF